MSMSVSGRPCIFPFKSCNINYICINGALKISPYTVMLVCSINKQNVCVFALLLQI